MQAQTIEKTHSPTTPRIEIGASETAAVLGNDTYNNPAGVYDRIVALRDRDIKIDDIDPKHIARGKWLEPVAAAMYMEETGEKLLNQQHADRCPEFEHLLSNPDRVIAGKQMLAEIWCPSPQVYKRIKDHGISASKRVQGQAQLACRPRMKAIVYIILSVDPFELFPLDPIERHDEYIDEVMLPGVREFWDLHVAPRIRPTLERVPAEIPPGWDGEVTQMNSGEWAEAVGLLQDYEDLTKRTAGLYDEQRSVVEALMEAAGAQVAAGAGVKITHKYNKPRMSLDSKRLDAFLAVECGVRLDDFKDPGKAPRPFLKHYKYEG